MAAPGHQISVQVFTWMASAVNACKSRLVHVHPFPFHVPVLVLVLVHVGTRGESMYDSAWATRDVQYTQCNHGWIRTETEGYVKDLAIAFQCVHLCSVLFVTCKLLNTLKIYFSWEPLICDCGLARLGSNSDLAMSPPTHQQLEHST